MQYMDKEGFLRFLEGILATKEVNNDIKTKSSLMAIIKVIEQKYFDVDINNKDNSKCP